MPTWNRRGNPVQLGVEKEIGPSLLVMLQKKTPEDTLHSAKRHEESYRRRDDSFLPEREKKKRIPPQKFPSHY